MIAVDTNILVYSHCEDSAFHGPAFRVVRDLAESDGPRVHDARIAAICLSHGVDELWTADRDFSRFPGLTVKNPLVS